MIDFEETQTLWVFAYFKLYLSKMIKQQFTSMYWINVCTDKVKSKNKV